MDNHCSGIPESGQRCRESDVYFDSFIDSANNIYGWGPANLYPPNTEIYHQDTPANDVYLVERGLAKLTWVEPKGHEVIVGLRRRYWFLGATPVLLKKNYAFTVTTLTPCRLRRISSNEFLDMVKLDAEFCRQLLRRLSEEIYSHGMKVAVVGCVLARERLVRFLCELGIEQGQLAELTELQKPLKLRIPLKLKELAQLIAVSPEHLSRLLKEMEQQDIIKRDKGWLIFTNPNICQEL